MVLRHGLLDAQQCGNLSAGDQGQTQAAVGRRTSVYYQSPIEQHSKKPDEARDKILALMGDLPRVELFARQKTPGWDAWGNEIASDITLAERS